MTQAKQSFHQLVSQFHASLNDTQHEQIEGFMSEYEAEHIWNELCAPTQLGDAPTDEDRESYAVAQAMVLFNTISKEAFAEGLKPVLSEAQMTMFEDAVALVRKRMGIRGLIGRLFS